MGEVGEAILRAFHDSRNWLVLGVLVLAGHLGGRAIARARLPAIIGYLLVGVVLGTSGLNVVNLDHLGMVSDFGLGIVAFMIGTELSGRLVRRMGRGLLAIILAESFGAFLLVAGLIWLACRLLPPEGLAVAAAAVTFGAMAPASAPAGTVAVLQQYRCKGPLTSLLLAVVGLDDGLAVVIYAFAIAWVKASLGHSHLSLAAVAKPLVEVFGGLAVGALVGAGLLLVAAATRTREHVLTLTVGAIMLCTGLANVLHLSLILSNLATGCVMANLSKHQTDRTYAAVRQITHVVFVLFFVVAGAHLDLSVLKRDGGPGGWGVVRRDGDRRRSGGQALRRAGHPLAGGRGDRVGAARLAGVGRVRRRRRGHRLDHAEHHHGDDDLLRDRGPHHDEDRCGPRRRDRTRRRIRRRPR